VESAVDLRAMILKVMEYKHVLLKPLMVKICLQQLVFKDTIWLELVQILLVPNVQLD